MIWARLDLNRNFHLDSEPSEWPFALAALGLSDDHMMGYLHFLDHNRDGSISLPASKKTHVEINCVDAATDLLSCLCSACTC
jgi:hypothetical protein